MIRLKQKGDFSKVTGYLEKLKSYMKMSILDKYGREGVQALASATPVDSGKTASSWTYEATISGDSASLTFSNTNVNKGVPIAIVLQYGHGTRNGGYVQGRDYINPAIQPVFDKMAQEIWKEVTTV